MPCCLHMFYCLQSTGTCTDWQCQWGGEMAPNWDVAPPLNSPRCWLYSIGLSNSTNMSWWNLKLFLGTKPCAIYILGHKWRVNVINKLTKWNEICRGIVCPNFFHCGPPASNERESTWYSYYSLYIPYIYILAVEGQVKVFNQPSAKTPRGAR